MDDQQARPGWYYAIVGNDGSNIGLARFLGTLGVVLAILFVVIHAAFW